ncbi:MAG: acetate kinase, partial [bacterium]
PIVREMSLEGLEFLGIAIDKERNASPEKGERFIERGSVPLMVIPTNEELMIARDAYLLAKSLKTEH